MPRYKHLVIKKVDLASLAPKRKDRTLSPRQVAQRERDEEIRAALNEAAFLPASQAVVIDIRKGQKLVTIRAAVNRIVKAEPRDLNWGVRGQSIVFSKGEIPGGRRSARSRRSMRRRDVVIEQPDVATGRPKGRGAVA